MKYKSFSFDEHISRKFNITAHKKHFNGNTGIHFHEFFEIELVIGGSGACMLNGVEVPLQRGSGYILTPVDFHNLMAEPTLELYNIMFDESIVNKELITKLFNNSESKFFSFNEEELKEFSVLADILIKERNQNAYNSRGAISNLTELLITHIIRKIDDGAERLQGSSGDIDYALRYIYTHLRENPSRNKVAEICNYSPNYFSRLFYEYTGQKYVDFLNSLKISRAKKLLSLSDLTVNEIAFECGFTSVSNFYRVFKKSEGIQPLSYKKEEKGYEK
ncbi:MAG: helix-turn-helix domain-containing protein [Clostridia bacterium]|nr:helix-turn-helix domain-containing protein [Clostridia bacterium]